MRQLTMRGTWIQWPVIAAACLWLVLACGANNNDENQPQPDQSDNTDTAPVTVDAQVDLTPSKDLQQPADINQPQPDQSVQPTTPDPRCSKGLSFSLSQQQLLEPVDHHGTFVNGDRLYVIGGNNYAKQFRTIWSAQIKADGELEPFKAIGELPLDTAGFGLTFTKTRVYIVSGRANSFHKAAYSATLNADGSLGIWRQETSLPEGRFHLTAAVIGDYFYAIGGVKSNGEATDTVYVARIGTDGLLGSFSLAATLPQPRSHHASYVYNGALYLHAGFMGNPFTNQTTDHLTVISATPKADGTLGTFETVQTLSGPVATHAIHVTNGCVFRLGGITTDGGTVYHDEVQRSSVSSLGEPAAYQTIATLPVGRSHVHHVGRWKDRFYFVGGSIGLQKLSSDVIIGRFQ